MNVSTMVSIMQTLGIGAVFNDDDAKAIALEYLNLANDELYRETASINCENFINDNLVSVAGQNNVILTQIPFSVSKVFPIGFKKELKGISIIDLAERQFHDQTPRNPEFYATINTTLKFFPIMPTISYNLSVWYAPERSLLQIETPEYLLPYPISYQSVLVDGALYYLFQDESGFKNSQKENEALRRWTKGKTDLKAYLKDSNKQVISTFRNA
jgi:hypothetical protein